MATFFELLPLHICFACHKVLRDPSLGCVCGGYGNQLCSDITPQAVDELVAVIKSKPPARHEIKHRQQPREPSADLIEAAKQQHGHRGALTWACSGCGAGEGMEHLDGCHVLTRWHQQTAAPSEIVSALQHDWYTGSGDMCDRCGVSREAWAEAPAPSDCPGKRVACDAAPVTYYRVESCEGIRLVRTSSLDFALAELVRCVDERNELCRVVDEHTNQLIENRLPEALEALVAQHANHYAAWDAAKAEHRERKRRDAGWSADRHRAALERQDRNEDAFASAFARPAPADQSFGAMLSPARRGGIG